MSQYEHVRNMTIQYYKYVINTTRNTGLCVCRPAGDVRQDEEDPDVNQENEENVKEEFADDLFT